ncbi:MAG TPA: FkbM family methyltransferase [Acidimicrobiales bacterium]|nr:FkbM family methyltransferase [Acidimicrobiales bacterium]
MISYAQNGEDVVLWRLFKNQLFGRYIDIGAADPVEDSVTKHFYDLGWRGVNVEPDPLFSAALAEARPEDVNLAVAVSDRAGTAVLHAGDKPHHGLATLEPEIAERVLGDNRAEIEVPTITLEALVDEYVSGPVDFLKIDVEGHEKEVIAGAAWETWRPRAVVVEATLPNTSIPSHERWEASLLAAEYCCVLFDGINRFYAQAADLEARAALSVPANVLDGFVRLELVRRADELYELQQAHRYCGARISELDERVHELEGALRVRRMRAEQGRGGAPGASATSSPVTATKPRAG